MSPGVLATALLLSAGPDIAVLSTPPGAAATDVHRLAWGETQLPAPEATIAHQAGAMVRGAVVDETTLAVVAGTRPTRDASFDSTLFIVADGIPYAACDDVVHASRPHVADGRVFVVRGWAGPMPVPPYAGGQTLRVDALTLELYRPELGATVPVHAYDGYLLHVAGDFAGEVIVYRVHPVHTDLVAIDPDSGDVRVVVPDLRPLARDFSVDPLTGVVTYVDRGAQWEVVQTDLATGATTAVFTADDLRMVPHAVPGRGIVLHAPREGLTWLGGPALPGPEGIAHVRIIDETGRYGAGLRFTGQGVPRPFAIDLQSGARTELDGGGAWIDLPGFVAGGAW